MFKCLRGRVASTRGAEDTEDKENDSEKSMSAFERFNLAGKVAVITGSSSGIGAATALLMAQRGAKVTIHGRRKEKLDELADQIEGISGTRPYIVLGDIEDSEVKADLINGTIENFGRLDILCNNAGWMKIGGTEQTEVDDLRTMLEIHVVGPYELCKMAIPELVKNKGNIVMTSSVCGCTGYPMMLAYSAAKAGMDNLMRSLTGELASQGVRVNSVNPGPVATDLLRNDEAILAAFNDPSRPPPTPMGRMASSEDVAELIAFLASDAAGMITGNTHTVDGGTCAFTALQ